MLGNATIALFLALGFAGWVYSKTLRSTGNNTQTAVIVAVAAGLVIFLLGITLLGFIPAAEN